MKCILCGNINPRILYNGNLKHGDLVRFSQYTYYADIFKCPDCSLVFQKPIHQNDEIIKLVTNEKYLDEDIGLLNIQEEGAKFDRLISIVKKVTSLENACLLDVGCNTGTFLNQVQRYTSNIFGIEPSEEAALHSIKKGYEVQNVIIRNLDYPDTFFDVITLWDVIEHLYDPPSDLDILFTKLKPGGKIFISTHNIDGWFAKFTGKRYPMLMYQHLFHFSIKTLRQMLKNSGFTTIKVVPFCKSWSIQYLYQLFDKLWPNSPITKIFQFCFKPFVANEKIASMRVVIPIRNFFVICAEKSI